MSGWTTLLGTLGCATASVASTFATLRMAVERPDEAVLIQIGIVLSVVCLHRWWLRKARS